MGSIITAMSAWIISVISALGYAGIVLLMGIESACIPLPSEVIMPFGGYLVYTQPERFGVWGMGVAGALGCVWGSALAYWAGKAGGRPFIEKYGRYLLISHHDLDMADRWFGKYGDAAVFFSRLLPIVRTYISFPAGIARVPFWRFIVYTFTGSLPWCLALAWAGKLLGEQWDTKLKQYFHGADAIIIAVVLVLVGLYIWRHVHSEREYRKEHAGTGKEL